MANVSVELAVRVHRKRDFESLDFFEPGSKFGSGKNAAGGFQLHVDFTQAAGFFEEAKQRNQCRLEERLGFLQNEKAKVLHVVHRPANSGRAFADETLHERIAGKARENRAFGGPSRASAVPAMQTGPFAAVSQGGTERDQSPRFFFAEFFERFDAEASLSRFFLFPAPFTGFRLFSGLELSSELFKLG